MDTTACEIQPCPKPVHTGYPKFDNSRWVPVCRPHLDQMASDWRLRARWLN